MTNLEAARAMIGSNAGFGEETYRVGLVNAGIDPDAEYVSGRLFDLALADMILFFITGASRVTEGELTIQIDTNALLRVRLALLNKWGQNDPTQQTATIRNKSYLW